MAAPLLTIEVSRHDGGRARVRLTGDLDFDTAPQFVDAVTELRRDGYQTMDVDLTGVTLCDSSGLSALLVAHRAGVGPVRLSGLSPALRHLLDRTGLAEVLAVTSSSGDDQRATG
ncbi:STAS domain-containing protein [Micromonospora krabiensis]|uniref:Anti-anti-sigma factor n=1 Tax=Micromonospora krabiensis TaxID=307121 RepID=A0A1C3N0V5_9ACTN|nr:STAS domain-containing protein [Micromonospora krabiensis]SBV26222.1 anti-anti-sigma factor [Micromonospora krabiensis]